MLSAKSRNRIQVLEVSEHNDYIIGDLHGNRECLEAVLNRMQNKDRLFIVGDLTDRGKDNCGVINKILYIQQQGLKHPQELKIFSVRGNHEQMTLKTIERLEKLLLTQKICQPNELATNLLKLATEDYKINRHMRTNNGGEWLVNLFVHEVNEQRIKIVNRKVQYAADSQIKQMEQLYAQLPVILHVKGNEKHTAFNVVHGSMPISDQELQKRILNNEDLTDKETEYALWARDKGNECRIKDVGRTFNSVLTYCGHNIVDKCGQAVRESTNTIDLDVGSYRTNVAMLVNHTQHTVELVFNSLAQNVKDALDNLSLVANEIRLQLLKNATHFVPVGLLSKSQAALFHQAKKPSLFRQVENLVGRIERKFTRI